MQRSPSVLVVRINHAEHSVKLLLSLECGQLLVLINARLARAVKVPVRAGVVIKVLLSNLAVFGFIAGHVA